MLGSGDEMDIVIVGFNVDDLTGKNEKAKVTFAFGNAPYAIYNAIPGGTYDYETSLLYTKILPMYYYSLPKAWKEVIQPVDKRTTRGTSANIYTLSEKLWLFSEREVTGKSTNGYTDNHTQYSHFVDVNNRKRTRSKGGDNVGWWLRTPCKSDNRSVTAIHYNTGESNYYSGLSGSLGIVAGFCC